MSSTSISELPVLPSRDGEDGMLRLTALEGDKVRIERAGLWLQDGETVNLVATITGSRITVVEKKGLTSVVRGNEKRYIGSAVVSFLPPRRFTLRYESQVTGQWTRLKFTNVPGKSNTTKLSY